MKRIIRLTESDLTRIVRRVMNESKGMINEEDGFAVMTAFSNSTFGSQYKLEISGNLSHVRKRGEGGETVAEFNCTTNKLQSKYAGYVDQMLPYLQRMCKAT